MKIGREEEEGSSVKHSDITITNSHMQDMSLFNPYMRRYFVNTKYPEAKGLPVLADGGLLQTTGKNTPPPLLRIKEVPLLRSMSAGGPKITLI